MKPKYFLMLGSAFERVPAINDSPILPILLATIYTTVNSLYCLKYIASYNIFKTMFKSILSLNLQILNIKSL
ncbi:hypothetical protein [Haploplasma modicum]|uniref:hypothetical protein n=1 Tax=Haploplasma modicum TaxID=2150 RepID=UPI00047B9179|nr:hypothetical protein [Haploplasma modicum]